MTIDRGCENLFEDNLTACEDNNTWNHNDSEGKKLADDVIVSLVFSVIFIILIVVILITANVIGFGLVTFALFLAAIASFATALSTGITSYTTVKDKPIVALYALSQYVTKNKRTPVVMELSTPEEIAIGEDLVSNFTDIKREILDLVEHEDLRLTKDTYNKLNTHIGKDTSESEMQGWSVETVNVGDTFNQRALKYLPTLCDVVKRHKYLISTVVSVLPAHTMIPPHVGYSSFVKRLMLGIEIPADSENCYLCVNGMKNTWKEGGLLLWDDTAPHAVYNKTNQRRIIVYMDIRRITNNSLLDWIGGKVLKFAEGHPIIKNEIAATEQKQKMNVNEIAATEQKQKMNVNEQNIEDDMD